MNTNPLMDFYVDPNQDIVSNEVMVGFAPQGIAINPVMIWKGILQIFGKMHDSTGFFEYRNAMKLLKEIQTTSIKNYGDSNAVLITDKKAVTGYLISHKDDKFKKLFKSVENLIDENEIQLAINNHEQVIANMIADHLNMLPKTAEFKFKFNGKLLDTSKSENLDQLMMLFRHTLESGKFSLMNVILAGGWEDFNNRIQATYKNLHDSIIKITAKGEITWNYDNKNISALYMIENQLSNNSYFEKGGARLKAWLSSNLVPSFGNKAEQAKKEMLNVFKSVSDTINEVITSNEVVAGKALKNINSYYEELIKVANGKDFKAR